MYVKSQEGAQAPFLETSEVRERWAWPRFGERKGIKAMGTGKRFHG